MIAPAPLRPLLWTALSSSLLAAGSCATPPDEPGFAPIFDGETLSGWQADPAHLDAAWSVRDGAIHGRGLEDRLAYLVYSREPDLADFELKFEYRMLTEGNTGVELRARTDPSGKRPFEGYHADLGHVGIGPHILGAWDFHFETREELPCPRGTRLVIDEDGAGREEMIENPVLLADMKERGWNQCRVVARGYRFQFFINGKLASEFTDNAAEGRLASGSIALQLHESGTEVEFRDLLLRRIP